MDWEQKINEGIRRGVTDLLILQLLSERGMEGHELQRELLKRTGGSFGKISLYGSLYRLNLWNFVKHRIELVGETRIRMHYQIEDAGKDYLAYGRKELEDMISGIDLLFRQEGIF